MKQILFIILTSALFIGCTKNDPVIFSGTQIEFDASTWNANAAGITYPILTRVPREGAATPSANALLTRTTGTITLRVNLVGAQRSTATDFTFKVVDTETTAVVGTHYTALSGTGSIAANSSFGYINIPVLNPGATTGSKILVLQLLDNATVKANVNYAKVGLSIAQN